MYNYTCIFSDYITISEIFLSKTATASGLHLLPKLKLEHVQLTSFSRMRVNLAAQVSLDLLSVYALIECDPFFRF